MQFVVRKSGEPSEFDRGYEQGFRAAMLTVDLTPADSKDQILQILRDAFQKVYSRIYQNEA